MSAARMQVRHFWPFNKRVDWSSHLDPQFARFQRQRHINTRAKLLKAFHRRNKWDLGIDTGLFFTPKHIRQASHYYGRGNRSRWLRETEQEDGKVENDGHELTEKEKLWKEQMEKMRQRIERDPYEAVFGKRAEPLWESMMPNWMREELGLAKKVPEKPAEVVKKAETAKPETSRYAYSSKTSWDSWTNKVRQSEWSSDNGSKHYEYDPISNRMVEIKQHTESVAEPEVKASQEVKSTENKSSSLKGERKAIPIPQFVEPALTPRSTNSDVDGLTAGTIRASMGKPKSQDHHQITALLHESAPKKSATSHFDHAETYYMLEQQLQTLQSQRDNLAKNESRLYHFGELAHRYRRLEAEILVLTKQMESLNAEQIEMAAQEASTVPRKTVESMTAPRKDTKMQTTPLKTALERGAASVSTQKPLRPAVDRMQNKAALTTLDPDDSAAHESTESVNTVPHAWSKQAELLQTDRVKRTAGKSPWPAFPPSWVARADTQPVKKTSTEPAQSTKILNAEVDRMVQAMSHHETYRASPKSAKTEEPASIAQLRSAEIKLQAREKELNNRIAELEGGQDKHKAKIAALKNELDIAYKQSSRHADEFRDQIQKAQQRTDISKALEQKYKVKIAALKEDLDTAFKQSSIQADEFRDHIKKAEAQLAARIKADESMTKIEAERQVNLEAAQRLAEAEAQLKAMSNALAAQAEVKKSLEGKAVADDSKKSMHRKLLDERFARYKAAGHTVKSSPSTRPEIDHTVNATSADQLDFNEVKHAYRFKPDSLEAELSGKNAEVKPNTYKAKKYNRQLDLADMEKDVKSMTRSLADATKWCDGVKHDRRGVHPVDGTTAPATGNYASPTGFVNFDPVVPLERTSKPNTSQDMNKTRIKRQEHVFSGTKRVHTRYEQREHRYNVHRRRAQWRRLRKAAILLLALAGVAAYVQGTSIERQDIRLQASQEVYRKMAEQYEKKGEQGLVEAVQENIQRRGGYFWK